MTSESQTVLIIGGSGAQGVPIVQELSKQGTYTIKVLTRDSTSENSKLLGSLPNVSLHLGPTQDEDTLRAAFKDVDLAFVNLNSFALGIKNEIWWGIRTFELAVLAGVKHFIWSSLDNYMAETMYDESLRVGHYYGQAYVEQWMSALPHHPMRWSILTTGPYIETLSATLGPSFEDGVAVFRAPLGDGAVPLVCLDDLGNYVHWIFSHPSESTGLNLKVAVEHVGWNYLAATYTAVTGKPARYEPVSADEWFTTGPMAPRASIKLGAETAGADDPSLLTIKENFTRWWNLYSLCGGNKGIIRRDYALLDRIHPGRIRSLEEWMRETGYKGEKKPILKVDAGTG